LTLAVQHLPENGSTEVTQSSSISARQHGGHEPRVPRQTQVAGGVHTLMNTVEPLPLYPPIDLRRTQPHRRELSAADHSVLPPR